MKALQKIGFVGLGNMGYSMAGRLVGAGFDLSVFDINTGAADRFVAEHQAVRAADPADLGRQCELVITMLPDDKVVQSVVLGTEDTAGLGEVLASESVIIDMSSSSPLATE